MTAALRHFPHSRILASGERDRAHGGYRRRSAPGLSAKPMAASGLSPNRWHGCHVRRAIQAQRGTLTDADDVIAVPTPGHTPSHLSVIVRDGDHQIMLAGDASYLELTMLRGVVDGVSPNEAVARATFADIRELCAQRPTIYLPAHDPKSAERLQERRAAPDSAEQTTTLTSLWRDQPKSDASFAPLSDRRRSAA